MSFESTVSGQFSCRSLDDKSEVSSDGNFEKGPYTFSLSIPSDEAVSCKFNDWDNYAEYYLTTFGETDGKSLSICFYSNY